MRFMFIVKATRESEAGVRPGGRLLAEMARYHDELLRAGVRLDASALRSSGAPMASRRWVSSDRRTAGNTR